MFIKSWRWAFRNTKVGKNFMKRLLKNSEIKDDQGEDEDQQEE